MKKFILGSLLAILALSTTVSFVVFLIMPTFAFAQIYAKSFLIVFLTYIFLASLSFIGIEISLLLQNFFKNSSDKKVAK